MANGPIDLTQKILIDIQERLGQMQVSIDKVEGRLDKIEKHTGISSHSL